MEIALGIEFLPLEVLEVIVTFLSAKDLSHCVGVSRAWYNIFSSDIFWKRHCITNSNHYFSKANNLVDPGFGLTIGSTAPIQEKRLQFLQEQHLLNNWDCGRFRREELVFMDDSTWHDFDSVSFYDNDHLFVHLTVETQVWNVAGSPFLAMKIPHSLTESFGTNSFQIVKRDLVVIQNTVVQIFKIDLDSKKWSRINVFLFNEPEEFSRMFSPECNVEALLEQEHMSELENMNSCMYKKVIFGKYMIGVTDDEITENTDYCDHATLHIWDIKTGEKIKEDKCVPIRGVCSIGLRFSKEEYNQVLFTYTLHHVANEGFGVGRKSSIIYDFSQLQFLMKSRFNHNGSVRYFDGNVSLINDVPLKVIYHDVTLKAKTLVESGEDFPCDLEDIISVKPLGNDILISTEGKICILKRSDLSTDSPFVEISRVVTVDFRLGYVDVFLDRYILMHSFKDIDNMELASAKEIRKLDETCTKVLEFNEGTGLYAASNEVCSKIVVEEGKKLIVLTFW